VWAGGAPALLQQGPELLLGSRRAGVQVVFAPTGVLSRSNLKRQKKARAKPISVSPRKKRNHRISESTIMMVSTKRDLVGLKTRAK
jgi:hypothetical protein